MMLHWAHPIIQAWYHLLQKVKVAEKQGRYLEIEWKDREEFAKWSLESGYQPGYTFIRYEVWNGYTRDNCAWIDRKKEIKAKRRLIDVDGDALTLREIAKIYECDYEVLARLQYPQEIKDYLNKHHDAGIEYLNTFSRAEMEAFLEKVHNKRRCRQSLSVTDHQ